MRSSIALVLGVALLPACGGSNSPTTSSSPPAITPAATPTPVASPTPPPLSVTGDWRSEARSWDIRLAQNGSTLRGVLLGFKNMQYTNLEDPALQITGTVSNAGAVEFKADAFALRFSGTAEAGGTRMTGTLYDCVNVCRNYGEILTKK